jgi:hypothetical protein
MTLTTNIYCLRLYTCIQKNRVQPLHQVPKQFFMFVYRFLKTDFFCHFDKSCKTGYVLILR